jgi:acetyl esterase/lipase
VPHDPVLRGLPLLFYPAVGSRPPRAVIFFYGNDVGFWQPHRTLARHLAMGGYSVVGLDIRAFFATLPEAPRQRDSAFAVSITSMVGRIRHELHAEGVPLVVAGHSLGAETAVWTGAHLRLPALAGIISMSPGLRSHLAVTMTDLLELGDPTGPGSFSVPEAVTATPPAARIALLRGDRDHAEGVDSILQAAGGPRLTRFRVWFCGHSLRSSFVVGAVMLRALDWVLEPRRSPRGRA